LSKLGVLSKLGLD